MPKLTREQKMQLGELIGNGHRHFGKVTPRRPYAKDDASGDGGASQLLPAHPLFAQQPIGASSDLTFLANENDRTVEEAEKRSNDLNLELQNKLEKKLGQQLSYHPPKTPEARPI